MMEEYSRGFRSGVEHARESLIEFLESHIDDERDLLTLAEVVKEIKHWQSLDEQYGLKSIADGQRWGLPLPLADIESRLELVNIQIQTLAKVADEIEQKAKDLVTKWQD